MVGYYKTDNGKVVELKKQNNQHIWKKCIIELVIPDGCIIVSCWDNQLTELIIPDGCEWIDCCYNQLKELIIPAGCVWVRADMKSVTVLNNVYELNLWI